MTTRSRRHRLLLPLLLGVILLSLALAGGGCTRPRPGESQAPQIATAPRTQKPMAADPLSAVDQPGALHDTERIDPVPPSEVPPKRQPAREPAVRQPVEGVSKTVQENVPAGVRSATQPAAPTTSGGGAETSRATTTRGAALGQFFTIGGVIADVNGTPIYANKVLNLVEPVLAARAKELAPEQFKLLAAAELKATRDALVRRELEYAAAEQNLDERDKDLAWMMTENWRARQVTEAGGSEELARRRAPEIARRNPQYGLNPDATFEELVQEMYRIHMSQVFYQKKIMPRVQVSASEMREYYERNRALFSERGVAQFRLIKVDVAKAGGREEAMKKITALRNRIVRAGEPFETIARSVNDNPLLLKTGGSVKIDQGAFAVKAVDDAVWSTPEGEVTEVIDAGDALYIAQVLERKPARMQPFEEEAVQARIRDDLVARDFRALRGKVQEQLEQNAVIRADPAMMSTPIDMAMQNYPRWAGKQEAD